MFEVATASDAVLIVVTFACAATTKGIVNVSKKKVVLVALAVNDEGTTTEVAFALRIFAVSKLEEVTFMLVRNAFVVVTALAAHMLLPGPFR